MRSQTTCSVSLFSSVYILTARLSGAGLSSARLSSARLSSAGLSGAGLSGARLSGAGLNELDCILIHLHETCMYLSTL